MKTYLSQNFTFKAVPTVNQHIVCFMFICFVQLETFSLLWRRNRYRWKDWIILTCGRHLVRVFYHAKPFVTRHIRLQWSFPKTRDTPTYCRAFGLSTEVLQPLLSQEKKYKTFNMRRNLWQWHLIWHFDILTTYYPWITITFIHMSIRCITAH